MGTPGHFSPTPPPPPPVAGLSSVEGAVEPNDISVGDVVRSVSSGRGAPSVLSAFCPSPAASPHRRHALAPSRSRCCAARPHRPHPPSLRLAGPAHAPVPHPPRSRRFAVLCVVRFGGAGVKLPQRTDPNGPRTGFQAESGPLGLSSACPPERTSAAAAFGQANIRTADNRPPPRPQTKSLSDTDC